MIIAPLKKAFDKAADLPDNQQKAVAEVVLRVAEEIADEARWEESFAHSQEALATLADEALAEFEKGKTTSMDEIL